MARPRLGRRTRPHHLRAWPQPGGAVLRAQGKIMTDLLEHCADRVAGTSRPKIDIRGLDFFYGKTQALKAVELAIPADAVTAIIGPSGCGKSTLLRAINRIYEIYPDQRAQGDIC